MSSPQGLDWPEHADADALAATTRYLIDRPSCLTRIVENAAITGETVTRAVSLEASSGPRPHFVAVASIARNKLIDLMTILPSATSAGTLVGRDETAVVTKLILQSRCTALGIDPSQPLVDAMTSVGGVPPENTRISLTVLERLADVAETDAPTGNDQQRALWTLARDETFLRLVRYFRWYRPLWVPVTPGATSFTLNFSFETGRREYAVSSMREFIRTIMGMSAYDLVFPISDALQAKTYHFRLRAPQNHYVSQCQVIVPQGQMDPRAAPSDMYTSHAYRPKPPAFVQYWPQDPDGLAHVYLGDVASDPERPAAIAVRVRFAERPLGQLGGALWRWTLVDSFLAVMFRLGPRLVETQSTVGVSVLLAIPAALGISTLSTASLGALNTPSGARIASILSGVTALVGAMSFVAWTSAYASCVKLHGAAKCPTHAPPGVQATLQSVLVGSVVLTTYCLVAVAWSLIAYRVVKRRRSSRAASPMVEST